MPNQIQDELRTTKDSLGDVDKSDDLEKLIINWHKKVTGQEDVKFTPDMQVHDLINELRLWHTKQLEEAVNKRIVL